jgi:hypothetical protein
MMRKKKQDEHISNMLSVVAIIVVALLLLILFKIKGGVLGIILGTLAVAVLVYWLMEIKNISKEQKPSADGFEWFYDVAEEGENVIFVGKVPGPGRDVKVRIADNMLEIKGGGNFKRRVQITKDAHIQETSYINGVLRVKLQKQVTEKNLRS